MIFQTEVDSTGSYVDAGKTKSCNQVGCYEAAVKGATYFIEVPALGNCITTIFLCSKHFKEQVELDFPEPKSEAPESTPTEEAKAF